MADFAERVRTVLTVSSSREGIRLYSRTSGGLIRELCLNISPATLSYAMEESNFNVVRHRSGWFLGELAFQCHRESQLFSLIDSTLKKSIFYQDIDGTLRERKHGPPGDRRGWGWTWHPTHLERREAHLGTSIAAVENGIDTMLLVFYQNRGGLIRYITSQKGQWSDNARPLNAHLKARLGSGLAAVRGNDGLNEVWLYYQDPQGNLCEYRTGAEKNFRLRNGTVRMVMPLESQGVLRNISAIRVHGQVPRLIFQDSNNDIIELVQDPTSGDWVRGDLRMNATTPVNITVCARETDAGYCVLLYWAGQDEVVHQRVWYDGIWFTPEVLAINDAGKVWEEFWLSSTASRTIVAAQPAETSDQPDQDTAVTESDAPDSVAVSEVEDPNDLIALQAEGYVRSIPRQTLCKASTLFKDMLSIPQPLEDADELHHGSPLIPLQESAANLELLINAITDDSALRKSSSAERVALLALATKYQAGHLFQRLIEDFEQELPGTFEGLVHLHTRALNARVPELRLEDTLELFKLVRRDDIQILLPSLLLFLCTSDGLAAAMDRAGLDIADKQYVLASRQKFGEWATAQLKAVYPPSGTLTCRNGDACLEATDSAARLLFLPGQDVGAGGIPCCACLSNFWEAHRARFGGCKAVREAWKELPSVFGLPVWEVMTSSRDALMKEMVEGVL